MGVVETSIMKETILYGDKLSALQGMIQRNDK
jgi:hypothetical protein